MNNPPFYSDIDVENGLIPLHGDVDYDMYCKLLYGLNKTMDNDRVLIYLNTEGGDFYQGLAIYDLIKRFSDNHAPVDILCNGPVMSSGIMVLQAARERISLPNTQFMIHYGSDSNEGEQYLKHNAKMMNVMKGIIKTRAVVTKRTLNTWFAKDTFLDTEQALRFGLIDKVLQHGKEENGTGKGI